MKKIILLGLVCMLIFSASAAAHSGRTDSSGGHNCSEKSKAKGLCTGYHYHNGGSGGSSSSGSKSGSSSGGSSSSGSSSSTKSSSSQQTKPTSTIQTSSMIIYINDKRFHPEPKPIISAGTNLLPIRSIGEALGAQVNWDKATSSITVIKKNKSVKLKLNSKKATVNGQEVTMSTSPVLYKDAVFAPIRAVAEGVGATVNYDSKANTLYIYY